MDRVLTDRNTVSRTRHLRLRVGGNGGGGGGGGACNFWCDARVRNHRNILYFKLTFIVPKGGLDVKATL
jgi:hypothetical protein